MLAKRIRDKQWIIPGGNINYGESPQQTAIRELKEETGLDAIILTKLGDYFRPNWRAQGKRGDKTEVFLCHRVGGEFQPNNETSEIKYWRTDALPKNLAPWHFQRIKDAVNFLGLKYYRIQEFSNI